MKKLTLVDGNSILFRAYYATAYPGAKLMQTSKGIYTNALFAFVGMFEKIMDEQTEYALVAFDTKEPTKRHLAYEGYKAGREKMPEELAQQIELVNNYIELSGIKQYAKPGYEADDIIGTVAKKAQNEGFDVHIYSSDKDLLQLVDQNITVHLLKKGMKEVHDFNPQTLYEAYELTHHQMIDLKALMGDPSDNIPGVPGIGEKTAVKLLKTYQTLENILQNADQIPGKLGENIKQNHHLAYMSKELVTIDTEALLDDHILDLIRKPIDEDRLRHFFQTLELHMFVKKMNTSETNDDDFEYQVVNQEESLKNILKNDLSVFFEFSDFNYHKADLWGIGLSDGIQHYYLSPEFALGSHRFKSYLKDTSILKNTYDYKAAKVYLMWKNIEFNSIDYDMLIAAYLIDSHLGKEAFSRIALAFEYNQLQYDEVIYGKGVKKGLPEPAIYQKHIASKAKAIACLKQQHLKTLKDQNQIHLLNDLEIPLSEVLAEMEFSGLLVDQKALYELKEALSIKMNSLEKEIIHLAGQTFNISSTKQLGDVLFETLKLPQGKKTKTGYSTDQEVLSRLKNEHPIIPLILEYRQITKLYSTYIEGTIQNMFEDNKVHTIYQQALTTTGRLSSLEPNLQNIPIRTEAGRQIRKLFIAQEGHVLLGADYSQIELRILAHIANVKSLIEAFNQDQDIHTKTAQDVFHVKEVTPEQRRAAKAVNFGIIYGMGAWSLSEDIEVSPKEAQRFIDHYLSIYPEIKTYMESIVEFAKANGFVETIIKRRRYIPELKSSVYMQRLFGERTALNAPIQGSAADVLKKAMVDLSRYLKDHHKQSKILLQVHDELILEVPLSEIEEMKKVVPKMMQEAYQMKVELKTSCDTGQNWYQLK
jgi:DNA polymerase-1